MKVSPGSRLGPYEILSAIGATKDPTTFAVVLEDSAADALTARRVCPAPSLHADQDEEDPRPSGLEIR